jgi:hypothetical protein
MVGSAGFAVRQAEDLEDAVTLLHASGERLIALVDATGVPLLSFAACDRRMAHLHAYILLWDPSTTHAETLAECYPSLKLWIPSTTSAGELVRSLEQATRALGVAPQDVLAHSTG